MSDRHQRKIPALDIESAQGQLAFLCGFCEGLIASAEGTDTVRAGGIIELKGLLQSLPWYKQWRGDGGLK